MLNSAPKLHKLMPEIPYVGMCDFIVEIAISETYFKFWPLKLRLTSTTRRYRIMKREKNMSPK
jgi:hypothetical protein